MDKLIWTPKKRKVSELKTWEQNPRKITREAFEKLKDRITKRGFHDVVKVDTDGTILSGNQRKEALIELQMKEVWTLEPNRKLTDEERQEIGIESNKNDGTWDFDMLANIDEDILLETGFDSTELDNIFNLDSQEDAFDGEEEHDAIKESKVKPGDIYKLGDHRIMCGDSCKKEDVDKLMAGQQADMVFTDPPYNMNYKSQKKGGIMNDNMSEDNFVQFSMDFIARMKEAIKTGGVFYICTGYNSLVPFLYSLKANGLELQDTIIWVKNMLGMVMNDYRHKHETMIKAKKGKKKGLPIMYGWNGGKHYFVETHSEADVWEVSKRATGTMSHPTQKPLELVARAIRNSSKRGEIVLDLFSGSASTMIAAEKEGRTAYLMELDPKYVEVAIKRYEAYTGNKAVKV